MRRRRRARSVQCKVTATTPMPGMSDGLAPSVPGNLNTRRPPSRGGLPQPCDLMANGGVRRRADRGRGLLHVAAAYKPPLRGGDARCEGARCPIDGAVAGRWPCVVRPVICRQHGAPCVCIPVDSGSHKVGHCRGLREARTWAEIPLPLGPEGNRRSTGSLNARTCRGGGSRYEA